MPLADPPILPLSSDEDTAQHRGNEDDRDGAEGGSMNEELAPAPPGAPQACPDRLKERSAVDRCQCNYRHDDLRQDAVEPDVPPFWQLTDKLIPCSFLLSSICKFSFSGYA